MVGAMGAETLQDHVVGFYERDVELVAAVAEFLSCALDRDGAAIVIATPSHRAAVEAALLAVGYPIGDFIDSGRYVALDAAETLAGLVNDDHIDPAAFTAAASDLFDGIDADGPIHAFGEMVALLWDAGNAEAAIELEARWNDLRRQRELALYCAYSMSSLEQSGDLSAAKQVCDQHSHVIGLSATAATAAQAIPRWVDDSSDRVFVPAPEVIREVRAFVRDVLRSWGEEGCVAEAEVIVTELASNAVLHARSPFRVSLLLTGAEIKIAVRDASTVPPERVHGHTDRGGGRGISIVAALSDAWASDPENDGKTIWATLTCSQPGRRAAPLGQVNSKS
jgi:anti-sigma regulatory factor (Ser/Thr protein kinase)